MPARQPLRQAKHSNRGGLTVTGTVVWRNTTHERSGDPVGRREAGGGGGASLTDAREDVLGWGCVDPNVPLTRLNENYITSCSG